jgi:peptidyl-prolyl cis-trans isomerase D
MMQQLRNSTKWIMILVAIAFVGLMVFEWGADISGRTAGGTGEIGRVNGTPLLYDDYMRSYRNLYDQAQSVQEDPITNAQVTQLENQAWDDAVTDILIQQELERRGIVVTDDEIREAALFSPPPDAMANPAFHTDGQFDLSKYQQFVSLADPIVQMELELFYRSVIPRGKLLRQVGSGIHVSDSELWDLYRELNETASVSYVSFEPQLRVSDDEISVTAREVADYYDDNREDYFVPASANVVSVAFTKAPTPEDTAVVLARADAIRQSILGGEDFAEVAALESQGPTAGDGGALGIVRRGDLVPAMDSIVFDARLNRVSEPVTASSGIHLLDVTERWGEDSAQVRHIVLNFERTDDSEIALFTLADSLEELGETMSLAEAAAILGLEADTLDIIETRPMVPGAGDVGEGGDWIFDPETVIGEVSPVFENSVSFYAMELVSFDEARYLTESEAESAIRSSIGIGKKIEAAKEEAGELLEEIRAGRSLSEVAPEFGGLEVRDAGPFTRTQFASGLGRFNAATGAAFGLAIGEVSEAVEAYGNVFVIERTASQPADSLEWIGQLEFQREAEITRIRQARLDLWIEALRDAADIVDRREQLLQSPDEQQAVAPQIY